MFCSKNENNITDNEKTAQPAVEKNFEKTRGKKQKNIALAANLRLVGLIIMLLSVFGGVGAVIILGSEYYLPIAAATAAVFTIGLSIRTFAS